jgi:hypothetical protein
MQVNPSNNLHPYLRWYAPACTTHKPPPAAREFPPFVSIPQTNKPLLSSSKRVYLWDKTIGIRLAGNEKVGAAEKWTPTRGAIGSTNKRPMFGTPSKSENTDLYNNHSSNCPKTISDDKYYYLISLYHFLGRFVFFWWLYKRVLLWFGGRVLAKNRPLISAPDRGEPACADLLRKLYPLAKGSVS